MTHDTKHTRNRTALPAAVLLTALTLAGCSTGHIGESWQCPLAEGGSCDSVVAADPAVPDTSAARSAVLTGPLWRVQDTGQPNAPVEVPCDAGCDGGFDPFSWLARLFAPETADREKTATSDPVRLLPTEAPPPAALPVGPAPANPSPGIAEAETASHPADPDAAEIRADGDDLRTDEVVARIWIAPFVDADGVYREASHVRVVLEQAQWRLGR